MKIIVVPNHNW